MKDEGDFRVWYEKELRKAGAFCEYMCSMTRQGVPDVFVCHRGTPSWHELKFVSTLPVRKTSGVLGKHPFTGPQRVFLRGYTNHGGLGLGVIGRQGVWNGSTKPVPLASFFLPRDIGADGDVTLEELLRAPTIAKGPDFGEQVFRLINQLREVDDDHGQLRLWREAESGKRSK